MYDKGGNLETTKYAQKTWLETKGIFFDELKDTLILTDYNGTKWICLTKYCDTGRKDLDTEKLLVWSWLYAYLVSPEQADELFRCAENGQFVITHDTASHHETSSVFNREYPWSPSCRELDVYAWVDVQIKTGQYETVTETVQIPDISPIEALLHKYCGLVEDENQERFLDDGEDEEEEEDFEVPRIESKERIRKYDRRKKCLRPGGGENTAMWQRNIPFRPWHCGLRGSFHNIGAAVLSGKSLNLSRRGDRCIGVVAMSDVLRDETRDIMKRLHDMDTNIVLLTGDNQMTADHFASQVGICQVRVQLLLEEKVGSINNLQDVGRKRYVHFRGRAAFYNKCGLQYALFVYKRRKYSFFCVRK